MIISKPVEIDPYVFDSDFQHYFDMTPDGLYRTNCDLVIHLGERPRTQRGSANPGCCSPMWTLDDNGDLYISKGYTWNGPTFLDDAMCRMLGSLVHDILCEDEAMAGGGCYSYWHRHTFFSRICRAQGEAAAMAFMSLWGLRLGNWANVIIEHMKERKRLKRSNAAKAAKGKRK